MRAVHGAALVALLSALFATGCPRRPDSTGKAAVVQAPAPSSPAARFVGLYELQRGRGDEVRAFTLRIKAVSPEGQVECEAAADDGELRVSPGARLTATGMLSVVIEASMQSEAPASDDAPFDDDAPPSIETWTIDAELAVDATLQGEVRLDARGGTRVQPITGVRVDDE
jgi:hypothetical protein